MSTVDLRLRGKRAFVTGGSRGIGLEIARALASEGVRVAVCARGREGLDRSELLFSTLGLSVSTYVADVTDAAALEGAIRTAATDGGGLDILVANAGGSVGGGLLESTASDWAATLAMNVLHAATAIRAAAPWLSTSEDGTALVISSISGWKPRTKSSYAVAKAAEIHLASALAAELAAEGIRVNALSPGAVYFEGGRWARTREADPTAYAEFVHDNVPRGRLVSPEEVADVACFVVSPRAAGINGAHIAVDAGQDRSTDRPLTFAPAADPVTSTAELASER